MANRFFNTLNIFKYIFILGIPAIFNFFDISYSLYGIYVLWLIAIAIFSAIL